MNLKDPTGLPRQPTNGTVIYLLPSTDYPGQAACPIATFAADGLEAVCADLRERGVELACFPDGPQKTDQHGVADLGTVRIAWFRDPDDNIISVFEPN